MTPLEQILQQRSDDNFVLIGEGEEAKDFGGAVIGVTTDDRIVYSRSKLIEIIAESDTDPEEDGNDRHSRAVEHFDYNIAGSLPKDGPVIVDLLEEG